MHVLLVGAGYVGLEKLQAILNNAPATSVTIVADIMSDNIKEIAHANSNILLVQRQFEPDDLNEKDIVVVAVNDSSVSSYIRVLAKQKKLFVNVADTPELCDFYLSSVVQKGDLKIAISTNGKSPTVAKRIKEQINTMIPDEIDNVLQNMQIIRKDINGDFAEKVKQLNEVTKVLAAKQITLEEINKPGSKKWQLIVGLILFAFFFMILGYEILSYIPFSNIVGGIKSISQSIDIKSFLLMLLTGFLAQIVDGSLGMGYGTISTTFLLAQGVNPAIVSSRVHTARVFSSGVSGYSHHRFGNINKKLFKTLIIPGILGAVIGASLSFYSQNASLTFYGQKFSTWIRIPLSLYTVYLGYFIMRKAFSKLNNKSKVKRAGWLAAAGGFMDAFAGGGWGTLVTSTLLSKRRSPRYVIGSVCLAEFFVVFISSITFFILLKSVPLIDVAGLIIGGLIAAPVAARLVGKLPMKTMFIIVGLFVIITSLFTLWKAIQPLF